MLSLSKSYKSKIFLFIAIVIILPLWSSVKIAFAHPLDTTDMYFYFDKDEDNSAIAANSAKVYLYINWFQASSILETAKGLKNKDIYEMMNYQDVYTDYALKHIEFTNNDKKCDLTYVNTPQSNDNFPMDIGDRLVFNLVCPDNLLEIKVKNVMVLDFLQFGTNYVSVFKGEFFVDKVEMNKYFTDMNITVKDGDAQIHKQDNFISTNGALSPTDPNYANQQFTPSPNGSPDTSGLAQAPSNKGFKGFTNTVSNYLRISWNNITRFIRPSQSSINDFRGQSLPSIMLVVFLLGLLHTLEAGHSKVVLTSAMMHKNMNIKKGMMYAVVFTLTHIGDILLVGVIFLFVNNFVDIYSKFSLLEKFAAYSLFFMALYLLFKGISDYRESKEHEKAHALGYNHHHDGHDHDSAEHSHGGHAHTHDLDETKSFRQQLMIGFLSGLAPCVFGWSIFMLILSSKQIWILFPVILSFALGILCALVLVVFIAGHLKKSVYGKFNKVMEFSPIISALVLLAYAAYIII